VAHHFKQDYLGEAVLDEDGTMAAFANKEAEAAPTAVCVQAVQGRLLYQLV
jgi:hypothetical protein